jgi:hypothetical protein
MNLRDCARKRSRPKPRYSLRHLNWRSEKKEKENLQSEDDSLLQYCAVQSRRSRPTFQRCLLPQSLEQWVIALMIQTAPLKCRSIKRRHGTVSQNAVIHMLAAVIRSLNSTSARYLKPEHLEHGAGDNHLIATLDEGVSRACSTNGSDKKFTYFRRKSWRKTTSKT